jgi:hypothetical protein
MEDKVCTCNNLAIAYIPIQKWETIYTPETGLFVGTIFPSLNMPFFKADTTTNDGVVNGTDFLLNIASKMNQLDRDQLMCKINEISFVVTDLTLYLDTHQDDQEAINLFNQASKLRKDLMLKFATDFYPLTQACMAEVAENKTVTSFDWTAGPAPWEGAII